MEALLQSWPGTLDPGWDGSALGTPAECWWPRPACCPRSIEAGGPFPCRCSHLRTGSLRGFWRPASTWTQGLPLSGQKKLNSRKVVMSFASSSQTTDDSRSVRSLPNDSQLYPGRVALPSDGRCSAGRRGHGWSSQKDSHPRSCWRRALSPPSPSPLKTLGEVRMKERQKRKKQNKW